MYEIIWLSPFVIESRPETPVNVSYHQQYQQKRSSPGSDYYTATSSGGSGTSLVIKRAGADPSSRQQQPQQSNKKPKLENNNVITLNANQLRSIIANNNNNNTNNNNLNNLSNLNLTKFVQSQQQKLRQQNQQNQLYLQQANAKRGASFRDQTVNPQTGGIHINPKHMVPTTTVPKGQQNHNRNINGTKNCNNSGVRNLAAKGLVGNSSSSGLAVVPVVGVEAFPKTFNHKELVS